MNSIGGEEKIFSVQVILLIPVAVALNVAGGILTTSLRLPVYLDMAGVVLVGMLAGPVPACVAGVLTNLVNGIFNPIFIPYTFVAFWIGVSSGLLSKYNMMNSIPKALVSGAVIALVTTASSAPITVFVFGGASGDGASMITAGLMAAGMEIMQAVLSVYIVTETAGKILSVLAAYAIIRAIPARSLLKFRFGKNFIKAEKGAER